AAAAISSSVVLPRAERTATTRLPCSRAATIRRAARLMRSASATDVPPNFITTVPDMAAQGNRAGGPVLLGPAGDFDGRAQLRRATGRSAADGNKAVRRRGAPD